MIDFANLVKEVFPQIGSANSDLKSKKFVHLGIDSFELMTFRTLLQQKLAAEIPDTTWISFETFADIESHIKNISSAGSKKKLSSGLVNQRQLVINMPQMNVGGLSEAWLFKEMGDLHWSVIAQALQKKSDEITDEFGNRLYATFVRIRFESSSHLKNIKENDLFTIENEMARFGKNLFVSESQINIGSTNVKAQLLSSFSVRGGEGNKGLLKADPQTPNKMTVTELETLPEFAKEYGDIKRQRQNKISLAEEVFAVEEGVLFSTEHEFNPYYELNGVNLLYFAAYPLIHEVHERQYVQAESAKYKIKKDWALESSTVAKDIFYFANCDIDDVIVFKLNIFEVRNGRVKSASSLYRKSDGEVLAKIFSVKDVHG